LGFSGNRSFAEACVCVQLAALNSGKTAIAVTVNTQIIAMNDLLDILQ
jgi:hypothetical protein